MLNAALNIKMHLGLQGEACQQQQFNTDRLEKAVNKIVIIISFFFLSFNRKQLGDHCILPGTPAE